MQDVRMIPSLQNLHELLLSWKTGQCRVSSVLTQLLGVEVITRLPGPSEQSSNDFLLGGRPTGLSIGLDSYKSLSVILVEKLNKAICFFLELITDPHVFSTSTNHLLYKYPCNALKLSGTIV